MAQDIRNLLEGRAAATARPLTTSLHYRPFSWHAPWENYVPGVGRARQHSPFVAEKGGSYPMNNYIQGGVAVEGERHSKTLAGVSAWLEGEQAALAEGGGMVEQLAHFPSSAALADWLRDEGLPSMDALKRTYKTNQLLSEDTIQRQGSFINRTKSPQEGYQLFRYGWPAGRDRIANAMAEFDRQFKREVERPKWLPNTSGSDVDVAAFVTGDPEHMIDYRPGQDKAKAVTVTVDVNVRCDACGLRPHDAEPTPPEWLLHRGVAATMLVRQLIRAGYQVTLRTVTHSLYATGPEGDYFPFSSKFRQEFGKQVEALLRTVVVDVLTPGQSIDLDNVIFALAHEDYIRRFDFLVHEVLNYQPPLSWRRDFTGHSNRYSRNSNPSVVGTLPLNYGFMLPVWSVMQGKSDIYLPSSPVVKDMARWTTETSSGNAIYQRNQELAKEIWRELLGEGFAVNPSAFDSTEASVMWTLRALEGLGVKFV